MPRPHHGLSPGGGELSQAKLDDVALHGSSLAGVLGGDGLRNVVVGPEQVLDLALVVLPSLGIRIEDPPGRRRGGRRRARP